MHGLFNSKNGAQVFICETCETVELSDDQDDESYCSDCGDNYTIVTFSIGVIIVDGRFQNLTVNAYGLS